MLDYVPTEAMPAATSKTDQMKKSIFQASASCLAYQRRLSKACLAVEIMGQLQGKKGAVPGWEAPIGKKKATNNVVAIKDCSGEAA